MLLYIKSGSCPATALPLLANYRHSKVADAVPPLAAASSIGCATKRTVAAAVRYLISVSLVRFILSCKIELAFPIYLHLPPSSPWVVQWLPCGIDRCSRPRREGRPPTEQLRNPKNLPGHQIERLITLTRHTIKDSGKRWCPRLRECCWQGQAEVVSNDSNKIHQT